MRQIFVVFYLLNFGFSFAQTGDNVPVVSDQFFRNYFLLNPALLNNETRFQFLLGNRTLTGLFEGVSRYYADGNYVYSNSPERFHSFGLVAMNSREGDYFSRTRAYGRYSFQAGLSENSYLSAGIAIGMVNYFFKPSPAGGGGSSFAPDGNVGIWYTSRKFRGGASFQQFMRSVIKPVNQIFVLDHYYNLNLVYLSGLGPDIQFEAHVYTRFQPEIPVQVEVAPLFVFYEKLEGGLNFRYNRGVAFIAGLRSLRIGDNIFQVSASYLAGTRRIVSYPDNVLEFSFGYLIE